MSHEKHANKVSVLYVILRAVLLLLICLQFAACNSFVCSVQLFFNNFFLVCSVLKFCLQRVFLLLCSVHIFFKVSFWFAECAGVLFAVWNSFACSVHIFYTVCWSGESCGPPYSLPVFFRNQLLKGFTSVYEPVNFFFVL